MYNNKPYLAIACVSLAFVLTGCAASNPTVLDFGLRRVPTTDRAKVLDGAEAILTDMGYALVQRDTDAGVLVYSDEQTSRATDTYRFTSNMKQRRVVELRVQSVPEGHKVFARVSIQRLATQAYSAVAFGSAGDDRPGQTAIDRDAATTTKQNTVWQTARRDKPTEQRILTAITRRIADASGGGS
jgi:hypothetical protein